MVLDPETQRIQEEAFIIGADLSLNRKAKFETDYRADRKRSQTAEMLFDRARVYQEDAAWDEEAAFGFNVPLQKGPFVDKSNWGDFHTWPFAVAMQRHLFRKVEEELLTGSTTARTHGPKLQDMLSAADDLAERLGVLEYRPSLIVLAGPLNSELAVEFWQHPSTTPDWDLDLPSDLWIHGSYQGILVATLAELSRSGVYVLDLSRLGKLTKHDGLQFDVLPINRERARSLSEKPGGSIHTWLLHVQLKLYESFSVELKDQDAVLYSAPEQ